MQRGAALTLDGLERKQNEALRLTSKPLIRTPREAEQFLKDVGVALRYHPGQGLPLASLYRVGAGPEPSKAALVGAIALTNHLLATGIPHADLVEAASRYTTATAAEAFLQAYLDAAVFGRPRKLKSLFKAFLAPAEIEAAFERLAARKRVAIHKLGRETVVLSARHTP